MSEEKSNIPVFESTGKTVENATNISDIVNQTSSEYNASGTAPIGEGEIPKQRKPRSDKGKPRGARLGMAENSTQDKALASAKNGIDNSFSIDKSIVEKTVKTMLATIDGLMVRKIGNTAIALGSSPEQARELAIQGGLTSGESEMMGTLSGVIAEKHGLLTGYAPEILLAMMLGGWGFRVTLTLRTLNTLAAEAKKKNVSPSSTDKDTNNREKR